MTEALFGLLGVVLGVVIGVALTGRRQRSERELARELHEQSEEDRVRQLEATLEQVKTAFAALSRDALFANTDDFIKRAKTTFDAQTAAADRTLEGKKKLIDAQVEQIGKTLTELNASRQQSEQRRSEADGALRGQLQKATEVTTRLQETTSQLREALANPQRRGQWGERMAEDVLRLAGFAEGINYRKQAKLAVGTIPDFTFMLPNEQYIHMDVKFPLANYLKMLDAADKPARDAGAQAFLKDVRGRIKEVTTRDYVDPSKGTLDFVLLFIPNEQIYGFIHEEDGALLDDALRKKVVLCSPLTLYAILAVIRQSVDSFNVERASARILELLAGFKKQWEKYVDGMDRMGTRLRAASEEYEKLVGTRTRQLDRQLDKIENLRTERGGAISARLEASSASSLPPEADGA